MTRFKTVTKMTGAVISRKTRTGLGPEVFYTVEVQKEETLSWIDSALLPDL